jgi:hypothetical protein
MTPSETRAEDGGTSLARSAAPVAEAAYGLWLWLAGRVADFPARHRVVLGDRLLAASLDVLEALAEASYAPGAAKVGHLQRASSRLGVVRVLVRSAKDLRLISVAQHEHAARLIEPIGRQVGGWIARVRSRGRGADAR